MILRLGDAFHVPIRSAHLEMGYAVGPGIPTIILMSNDEPELMYKMASAFAHDLDELVQLVEHF